MKVKATATIDRPKLERSLKSAAKKFGETNKQAVVRWGVNTGKDLAIQTQVWGRTKTSSKGSAKTGTAGENTINTSFAKGLQENAMVSDAFKVVRIVPPNAKNRNLLRSSDAVNSWIESNRTARRGRTAKLHIRDRRPVTESVFKAAMKERFKKAGMAKGGWLDAAQKMVGFQTGAYKINVGRGYISYAQKHMRRGSAIPGQSGFSPIAKLTNGYAHSADKHVLPRNMANKSIYWGLRKTISWYRIAAKKSLDSA